MTHASYHFSRARCVLLHLISYYPVGKSAYCKVRGRPASSNAPDQHVKSKRSFVRLDWNAARRSIRTWKSGGYAYAIVMAAPYQARKKLSYIPGIIFGKLHWDRPGSLAILARTDTQTYIQTGSKPSILKPLNHDIFSQLKWLNLKNLWVIYRYNNNWGTHY